MADEEDTQVQDLADYVVMILHCDECGMESDDSDRATPLSAAEDFYAAGWRFQNQKVLCFGCGETKVTGDKNNE